MATNYLHRLTRYSKTRHRLSRRHCRASFKNEFPRLVRYSRRPRVEGSRLGQPHVCREQLFANQWKAAVTAWPVGDTCSRRRTDRGRLTMLPIRNLCTRDSPYFSLLLLVQQQLYLPRTNLAMPNHDSSHGEYALSHFMGLALRHLDRFARIFETKLGPQLSAAFLWGVIGILLQVGPCRCQKINSIGLRGHRLYPVHGQSDEGGLLP